MNTQLKHAAIALIACTVPMLSAGAGEKPFAKRVPVLDGSTHEGLAIGKGSTACSGSPDGSIYKVDLRSGQGEILVPAEPGFDVLNDCYKLGMRVDRRSNYLFVAGYFTDFGQPFLYRLPLSCNGRLPAGAGAATPLPLSGDSADDHDDFGFSLGNGIVATPDGQTLIVGNSANAQIYRVDPATGHTDQIIVEPPLEGFLDGIVMHDGVLFILTPYEPSDPVEYLRRGIERQQGQKGA